MTWGWVSGGEYHLADVSLDALAALASKIEVALDAWRADVALAAERLVTARGRVYRTPRPAGAEQEYFAAMDALYAAVLEAPDGR